VWHPKHGQSRPAWVATSPWLKDREEKYLQRKPNKDEENHHYGFSHQQRR
jgi:hypothetical protein